MSSVSAIAHQRLSTREVKQGMFMKTTTVGLETLTAMRAKFKYFVRDDVTFQPNKTHM